MILNALNGAWSRSQYHAWSIRHSLPKLSRSQSRDPGDLRNQCCFETRHPRKLSTLADPYEALK